ncbi:BPSS1780 family membrane protein [Aquabacterium sp.]|uniref:BPSS1780 family membrane protein n=1 Tax=Aquabacterium sp. TaxID=1872578 RepID=UPI002D17D106|nr:BPSS1780 family membrane protein [Aquabacterium sp.]HSW04133.1 BPSS1780 family membrane protein [Aquabacterium sp.]
MPRGQAWLRQGIQTFLRRPLGFVALFLTYLLLIVVLGVIPLVGAVLAAATVPLLSLSFMLATEEVLQGRSVRLSQVFALWREPPRARRAMLLLCAAYGLATMGITAFTFWIGGDELVQALKPLGQATVSAQELMAVFSSGAVAQMANWITGLMALIAVPYWHALALVHWGGQSAGQALFSSTIALWRTRGAFMIYGLSWLGFTLLGSLLTGLVSALLSALLGAPALGLLLALLIMVGLSAAFYTSLWFIFADTFGVGEPPTAG